MKPKVLIYDIETSPMQAWVWRIGSKINISPDAIHRTSDIICICYKWLGERETHSLDWGLHKQDSAAMLQKFATLLAKADVVLAHNGDRFDVKHINTQRLLKGQKPLNWPTSEDTLKMLRQHFAFPSFKLDYLAKALTGSGKDKMELQDWIDIVEEENAEKLEKMIKYCKKDVKKLEAVFRKTQPFLTLRAHRGIIKHGDSQSCQSCGSFDLRKEGFRYTNAGRYQRYRCRTCFLTFKGTRRV